MQFIGREQELSRIKNTLSSANQSATLVYGRRRVGKSELIKRAVSQLDAHVIYYECTESSESSNVADLANLIADEWGLPPLAFGGVKEVLAYLFQRAADERIVLVLDEYPYLRKVVKGLDSILQAQLDRNRGTSHLSLVVCGSFVEVMRSLLEKENPLYGRIDLSIELKPMDYYEASLFYPDFSPEDKVRLYSVFGGVPYYTRLIDSDASVRENIIELIAQPGARLENEVSMYLSSELSKIVNANEVFRALTQGYSRYKDILDQSHVSSGPAMVDILEKLIKMELVRREAPINDPKNKKKAGYRVVDSMSLFYYRYIFRHASQRAVLASDAFYERYIDVDFESNYVPHVFEEVCRQYLVRKNKAGELPELFDEIGRYWYDDPVAKMNGEFDIVTRDPKGYVFYEAKFRSAPITESMIAEEIQQVKVTGLDCYKYGFFSRGGFEVQAADGIELVDIAELFED